MNTNSGFGVTKSSGCGCGGSSSAPAKCSCGGGSCGQCQGQDLVRPNFFAGQLLTEEDLQSLNNYVVAKNRLHNRHLFGPGVVCGLDVNCEPCGGGTVTVNPGYALDCCGNDIAVACEQKLDINNMIRDLRRDMMGGYDCGDPCADKNNLPCPPEEGPDVTASPDSSTSSPTATNPAGTLTPPTAETPPPEIVRHYCLYITYCEQMTDPVTPYASDEPCGFQSCQPTRVREGFRFELRCAPTGHTYNDLLSRICGCVGDVVSAAAAIANLGTIKAYQIAPQKIAPAAFDQNNPQAHAAEITQATSNMTKAVELAKKDPTEENIGNALESVRALNTFPARFVVSDEATKAALSSDTKFNTALESAKTELAAVRQPLEEALKAKPRAGLDKTFTDAIIGNAEEMAAVAQPIAAKTVASKKAKAAAATPPPSPPPPAPAIEMTVEEKNRLASIAYSTPRSAELDREELSKLRSIREELLVRLEKSPHRTDCTLADDVRRIVIPEERQGSTVQPGTSPIAEAQAQLYDAIGRYFRGCVCAALNPPCQPCDDMGVLLACLEVKDCRVLRICNLERTFVLTAPALRYWFMLSRLGDQIEKVCCPEPKPVSTDANENRTDRTALLLLSPVIAGLAKVCGLDQQAPDTLRKSIGTLTYQPQFKMDPAANLETAMNMFAPQLTRVVTQRLDTQVADLTKRNEELKTELSRVSAMAEQAATFDARLQKLEASK